MNRTSKRWPHAAAGIVMMLLLSSMYAWSYFKVVLGAEFPEWSQKQITLCYTLLMVAFTLGGLFAGSACKRVPKPALIAASSAFVFAGFMGASFAPRGEPSAALMVMYILYGGCNGFGVGLGYNSVLSSVPFWFPDHSGLISGALLMGIGFGSLLLGEAASVLVAVVGVFGTFRVFAVAVLVLGLCCAPFIRLPGPDVKLPPPPAGKRRLGGRDYSTAEMLRRPTFWLFFVWNVTVSASGHLIINSASSIAVFYGAAATAGLLVSVFNGLGRLLTGQVMDKFGWKRTMLCLNGLILAAALALMLGGRLGSPALVFAGMLAVGVCFGGGVVVAAELIRDLYGEKDYAGNFGLCTVCTIPAVFIGPMISAALQDGGAGYGSTFAMVLLIGVVSMALDLLIRKP